MDPVTQRLMMGASGSGGPKTYVEDVFSTWLYTGNSSTQTITNGIDLSGKGGLVWIKGRSNANTNHRLFDTARGATKNIISNTDGQELTNSDSLTAFSSTGFSLGADTISQQMNASGHTYASWTFRKAEKFFDVCTWTGSGANRTISHNLGSVPGCVIVKRTDTTGDWQVYHRSLANTEYMVLNSTAAKATGATRWNSTTPTSTVFSLGTDATVNASGGTYVAYLFAHDAGGFGDSGNDSVVSCGTFTTDGSGTATVTLGWEPQWLLIKSPSIAGNWLLIDNMRGWSAGNDAFSFANTSGAEATGGDLGECNSTGFSMKSIGANLSVVYIAIRRGPMKTPTSGTEVFNVNKSTNATAAWTTGFPVDLLFNSVLSSASPYVASRMTGSKPWTRTSSTNAEASDVNNYFAFDATTNTMSQTFLQGTGDYLRYSFRRAPGFFDVVAYTGTGVPMIVNHNLGVVPDLTIIKPRSATGDWKVAVRISPTQYDVGQSTDQLRLNQASTTSDPQLISTNFTSTTFRTTAFWSPTPNASATTYIAYLFATCPGVSKVGIYTGTGTTLNVDCGFTSGARFVMIKRRDTTGDWYVWDTARGIVSGNDPYLLLNSAAAEVTGTDYIDPLSSGFQISSTAPAAINANGGSFIFLAIA